MKRQSQAGRRRWLWYTSLALPSLLVGCASGGGSQWWNVDNCSRIPRGAIPEPVGSKVLRFQNVQAGKAEADDFVIYKHEWFLDGQELGPYGRYHLNLIARRLPEVPFPVVVQQSNDEALNEARRQVIIRELAVRGILDAPERVIVAFPEAEGMYGEQAEATFQRMMTGGGGGGLTGITPFGGFRGTFRGGLGGGFLP
ncbi:MAG: hypothetical protein NZ700_18200 [Gemmataceae bacterium]|nr:hypothetical protein [Gemmataceae bacterium]MDW8265469.1 hypothetical protein [Gemmataceae bacterium]